jgi:hypothetical protein
LSWHVLTREVRWQWLIRSVGDGVPGLQQNTEVALTFLVALCAKRAIIYEAGSATIPE